MPNPLSQHGVTDRDYAMSIGATMGEALNEGVVGMGMPTACKHLSLVAEDGKIVGDPPPRNGQAVRRGIRKRRDRQIKLLVIKEHVGHITHSIARIKELTEELERDFGLPNLDVTPRWRRPDLPFLGSTPLDLPDQSA